MSSDENKSNVSSLLDVNRLDYKLPPSLSIATSRAMKSYRSTEAVHVAGNSTVQFQLSTGATYVDFKNSFLTFQVQIPAVNAAAQGFHYRLPPHTGFANMIQGYRIIHSSGVELDRQNEGVGEWIQIDDYYQTSKTARKTQSSLYMLNDTCLPSTLSHSRNRQEDLFGSVILEKMNAAVFEAGAVAGDPAGWPGKPYLANNKNDKFATAQTHEVIIPLAKICGMFNCDSLAPSFLAAGLRIELDFYPAKRFFMNGVDPVVEGALVGISTVADVLILNPEVHLETFTLTDSMVRKLSQISAANGLEWYWDAVHQMNVSTSQQDLTIQCTRALSRANSIVCKVRDLSSLSVAVGDQTKDSINSAPWVRSAEEGEYTSDGFPNLYNSTISGAIDSFQIQLGAQHIPSRPLFRRREIIASALKTFTQFRKAGEKSGPTEAEFAGERLTNNNAAATTPDIYTNGLAIVALPLESSSTLNQSGAAISAQRTAVINIHFATEAVGMRRVDTYVTYSKLATLFLDSVVVRS